MDPSPTQVVSLEAYGDVVFRLIGLVDMERARLTLTFEGFIELMEAHPRTFFGSCRLVGRGDGQWDPYEVWVPLATDNLDALAIGVRQKDVRKWRRLWAPVLAPYLWGVWCAEDASWCQGTVGSKKHADDQLPGWASGAAASVDPGHFHYEVRAFT